MWAPLSSAPTPRWQAGRPGGGATDGGSGGLE
jgi:hypothetical protein